MGALDPLTLIPVVLHLHIWVLALVLVLLVRRHRRDVLDLPRGVRYCLLLLVLVAAGLRLSNLEAAAIVYSDEFEVLLSARHMLVHTRVGYPLNLRLLPPAHRSGYPALTTVPLALLGGTDRAAALVSAIAGILAVPLTFALVHLLFRDPWGALAAAALVALSPEHVHYSVTGWSAASSFTLTLLALVLAVYSSRRGRALPWTVAAAIAAGLATQVRTADTVVVPVIALYLWYGTGARRAALFTAVALVPSLLLFAALPPGAAPQGGLPSPWAEGAFEEFSFDKVLQEGSDIGTNGSLPGYLLHVFAGVHYWTPGPPEPSTDPIIRVLGNQWGDIDPLVVWATLLAFSGMAVRPRRGHVLVLGYILALIAANSFFASDPRHVFNAACLLPVLAGAGLGALASSFPGGGRTAAALLVIMLLRFHTQGTPAMLQLHAGKAGAAAGSIDDLFFQNARTGRWLASSPFRDCTMISSIPLATAFYTGSPAVDVRAAAGDVKLRDRLRALARSECVLYLDTCADWVPVRERAMVQRTLPLEVAARAGTCRSWIDPEKARSVMLYRVLSAS